MLVSRLDLYFLPALRYKDTSSGAIGFSGSVGEGCVIGRRWRQEKMDYTRITVEQGKMGGAPCIRGLRIPVATVVGMISSGMSEGEILSEYPDLESEDIREALRYAAEAVRERAIPLVSAR
jgi:uncharacterized protein (DUF433 family)